MPIAKLDHRTLVRIGGEAAQSFLQNLITLDTDALGEGIAMPAALLTPQGKIQFDFLLSRQKDGAFLADIRADSVADFIRRLTIYRLRAAVTFDQLDDVPVHAAWDSTLTEHGLRDGRFPEASGTWRIYGDGVHADAALPDWDLWRIGSGVAESGADFALSEVWPHDILMDLNGGVGFRKGCFVGQEVVSRMQHRKTARRRVAIVTGSVALPETGTAIEAGGRAAGELGTVVGEKALSIVRTDRIADALAAGEPVRAGGIDVALALPAWSGLAFEPRAGGDTAGGD